MQGIQKRYTGGTTVKGGTLTVKGSNTVGTGAITLGAGTTLALTADGKTFTALTNTLNLPTGENEKATIRIDGARLKPGDHVIASNVAAGTANVVLDSNSAALDGRKGSLRVENDELILNVNSGGLIIYFQ